MIVELKQERSALKAERKGLVEAIKTRELNEDEQQLFNDLSAKIDSLSSRIESLEKVEDDDDPEEDKPEDDKGDGDKEEKSATPRHLGFKVSTSKTRKDSHEYNISRALSLFTEGRRLDGLEGERSAEIAVGRGKPAGFYMPWDAKLRGRHQIKNRDATTSTLTGAVGITVEPTLIDLLRARMVFAQAGGTIYENVKGKFALPRQNAASTYYFVAESSNVTNSNPTLDQVNFVPKTMGIRVLTSRKAMFETSINAMTVVENDILKSFAVGLDATCLAGTGSGASPTGVLYNGGVSTITLAADSGNGGALTYADAVNFETTIAASNADLGSLAWVTTPGVRGKLKDTPKIGSTFPVFTWSDDNRINGYDAYVTTNMPNSLTKGTGTGLHSAIYGNWNDAVLALWSGIDIVNDPFTQAAQGAVVLTALQEVVVQLLHGQSFAITNAINVS